MIVQTFIGKDQEDLDRQIAAWQPRKLEGLEALFADEAIAEIEKATRELDSGKCETFSSATDLFTSLERPAKCSRPDAMDEEDKYAPFGRSRKDGDIRAYIEDYMRFPYMTPAMILAALNAEHSIEISHQKLGGYMGAIKKQAAKEVERYKETVRLLATPSEKPPGFHQTVKTDVSYPKAIIPTKEPEATIYRLWKSNATIKEIKDVLVRHRHYQTVGEIKKIIEGFA